MSGKPVQREPMARCWLAPTTKPYASVWLGDRSALLHRAVYEAIKGPIQGQVDHKCGVTRCYNPDHLEDVTPLQNVRRSTTLGARATRTNRCTQGHSLADAIVRGDGTGRMCRPCNTNRSRERRAREREEVEL